MCRNKAVSAIRAGKGRFVYGRLKRPSAAGLKAINWNLKSKSAWFVVTIRAAKAADFGRNESTCRLIVHVAGRWVRVHRDGV